MAFRITATLEPGRTFYRIGETKPVFEALDNEGPIVWATSWGQLIPIPGEPEDPARRLFLPAAMESHYSEDAVIVTAQDDYGEVDYTLDVYATFPFPLDVGYEREVSREVDVSTAEDGSERFQLIGPLTATWRGSSVNREYEESLLVLAFYAWHDQSRYFFYGDTGLYEMQRVRFNTPLNESPLRSDGVSYSFGLYAPKWELAAALPSQQPDSPNGPPLFGEGGFGL